MAFIQVPTGLGPTFTVQTSSDLQTAFVQGIVAAEAATSPQQVETIITPPNPNGAPGGRSFVVAAPIVVELPFGTDTITGAALTPVVQVLLDGSSFNYNDTSGVPAYFTGGTSVSTVIATTTANITNNNASGALLAVTTSGQNTITGAAGANQFVTAIGGQDLVTLNGRSNSLTSNGSESVLVGGQSTITASSTGADNVIVTAATTLAFINNSSALGSAGFVIKPFVDQILADAGGTVIVAGGGNTSVSSAILPGSFVVDTSAGNVTLNGGGLPGDRFTFVRGAVNGSANIQVSNFATGDAVQVNGYAGYTIASSANPGGSVLSLGDGSKVTFGNLSAAALQSVIQTG